MTAPTARHALAAITAVAALGALGLACGGAPAAALAPVTRTALATTGDVVGVVELGDALYVFARGQVTIERAGVAQASVPAPGGGWAEAIAMPALDQPGSWVVARTQDGALWRITASADLEPVHDLLGVPAHVRSIAASPSSPASAGTGAGATVAIGLDDGVAVLRDRAHLERFTAAPGEVSASHDRIAIRRGDQLELWNLGEETRTSYRVPGAIAAAFTGATPRGTLVVATRDALFIEAGATLRRRAVPGLHALGAAGSRLWIATARGVAWLDGTVIVATAVPAAATDRLFGLAGGDVVVGSSPLARLAPDRAADDPRWHAVVEPIFERVCARCHRPGGDAGVDLATAADWRRERAELVHRVVETHTMPPAGVPFDEADRRLLAGWLAH